jgi:hypothetical protein
MLTVEQKISVTSRSHHAPELNWVLQIKQWCTPLKGAHRAAEFDKTTSYLATTRKELEEAAKAASKKRLYITHRIFELGEEKWDW